jgi:hypothetical protein
MMSRDPLLDPDQPGLAGIKAGRLADRLEAISVTVYNQSLSIVDNVE